MCIRDSASALAKSLEDEAPHLIYFPEKPFDIDSFLGDVEDTYWRIGGAFIVVGEGLRNASGEYIEVQHGEVATDSFGHPADFLDYARPLIQGEVEIQIEGGLPAYVRLRKSFVDL